MKKIKYYHHVSVSYDPNRSRAPWSIDGVHHFNDGNLAECEASDLFGYGFRYDTQAVPFDLGSDIEPLRMSVKSNGCSLACVYSDNKDTAKADIIAEYFRRVHSVRWVYVIRKESYSDMYQMDATEFQEFVERFGGLTRESGKTYYKIKIRTTQKMEQWLMARV